MNIDQMPFFPRLLLMLAVVAVAVTLVRCVSTPVTGRMSLQLLPEGEMNSMGVQAYKEMKSKTPVSRKPEQKALIERIGRRIAQASGKKYDWEFEVFDEPQTVNAFCLPGGKIAFYTGIFPVAANEAGIAAIMGHEVAHAVAGHGNERISQSLIVQLGLSAADVTLSDSRYKKAIFAGLALGAQFGILLPYSRAHESEADLIGLKYMASAGFDPAEAPLLWDRMAKSGAGKIPEFMSTHPDPANRASKLRAAIPSVADVYGKSEKQPSLPLSL
ncbi:M48 family peptidase [bacterium]|nr:M48 family peptidase [bacterium]